MDRELLTRFIEEKKGYPIYPPISVNTTRREGAEIVADFLIKFNEEFEQWKKASVTSAGQKEKKRFTILMESVTTVADRAGLLKKKWKL